MNPALRRILDDLEHQRHLFDLDRDGFGEALMDSAVESIILQMAAEQDPDGAPWPPLSEAYEQRKDRISPGNPMSFLHGLMDDPAQLVGERSVSATEATMTYGTDPVARQEATWFQEGNAGQPARPFYGLGLEAQRRMDDLCDRRLEDL